MKQWARNYTACKKCSETGRTHQARGLCTRCYQQLPTMRLAKVPSQKRYRAANPEKVAASKRAWQVKKKAYLREYNKNYVRAYRARKKAAQGNKLLALLKVCLGYLRI